MKDSLQIVIDSIPNRVDSSNLEPFPDSNLATSIFGGHMRAEGIPNESFLDLYSAAPDWLSLVLLGLICYFILVKYLFSFEMSDVFRGIFKIEVLDDVSFDKTNLNSILALAPVSIFIYSYYLYFFLNPLYFKIELDYLFILFSLAVFLIFLLKKILEFFVAIIFNTQKSFSSYLFDHLYIQSSSALLQLPFLIAYIYSQLSVFLWISIGLMLVFWLYRLFRSVVIGYSQTLFSKSYLFLYLCSLEILPIFWVLKWISIGS